ncbi:molybdopterin synthase sulfur carrier subunit [Pullulanibacillus camelliae]|uniref:Molybdopterin synthase sulfur carrier subunit n=1 Tax=Pullulanibacillus camelliae TaxID=1707096 RepID=A0A8J2YKW4_9BACL|nr:molybdopterin converting factor subunit 1 [Pullulanibacillus camelliae]GGE50733.1 molybdopterin synthase sulfur carrier subunit [Pullulanibacillus camelliae]
MIQILFFAGIQEELGIDRLEVEPEGIYTVKELKGFLQHTYHSSTLQQSMTAINENFVTEQEKIKEGDIVAFIPPVSGG